MLWMWHNKEVFEDNNNRSLDAHQVILNQVLAINEALNRGGTSLRLPTKQETWIYWSPPPSGWIKKNTDGSTTGNLGQAG